MTTFKKDYLLIEGRHGTEEFKIIESVYGSGLWVVSNTGIKEYGFSFGIQCDGDPLPLNPSDDSWGYSPPNIEINYWTGSTQINATPNKGEKLEIKKCVSPKYGYQTNIYRVSHECLDEVCIEIVSIESNLLEVKIQAETWDVAIGKSQIETDGMNKPARISVYTTLRYDDKQCPTFD